VPRATVGGGGGGGDYDVWTVDSHQTPLHPLHQFDIDVTVVVLPSVLWMNDMMMMMMMLCMTGDEEL